jgi:hypothetical protein
VGITALRRAREQAAIVREPLDNLRLLKTGAPKFDRIVIDAHDRAAGAIAAGLAVDVIPYGYHESYAGPINGNGDRPIDAVLLGHFVGRHGRRQRLVETVERGLAARGIGLTRLLRGTYGKERADVLARTRVVLDIHRLPGNWPGFRFIVASAGGAALISEPLARPEPLVPGVHYVEAAAQDMADAAAELLADEPRRRRLVAAAQHLLATELHLNAILPRVVEIPRS